MQQKISIIYVAGAGRSGSTLVDKLLGSVDGIQSVGEVAYLWDRGVQEGRTCSCGAAFSECPFWTQVDPDNTLLTQTNASVMCDNRNRVGRIRHVPRYFLPRFGAFARALAATRSVWREVYAGMAHAAPGQAFVDSSKRTHGFVLHGLSNVEVHVVHVVRDCRAVVFSWQRKKAYDESGEMPQIGLLRTVLFWYLDNLQSHLLGWKTGRYARIRYEDFMADPKAEFDRLLGKLGIEAQDTPFTSANLCTVETGHLVSGNPMRFKKGELAIREDEGWKKQMSRGKRFLVAALALPLLKAYRYPFFA